VCKVLRDPLTRHAGEASLSADGLHELAELLLKCGVTHGRGIARPCLHMSTAALVPFTQEALITRMLLQWTK
jgi:hypothetical protein